MPQTSPADCAKYVPKAPIPFPEEVRGLVEQFRQHRETYKSTSYNEAQVRQEFINPFFASLGWDMENKAGYSQAYKDVRHEDKVLVGQSTKSPDYSFNIGGVRKFFVEAKKPRVKINTDIDAATQIRRYGKSGELKISILTDFEEFSVYDTRQAPKKGDSAEVGKRFYCTFDKYEEHWDFIAGLFAKESILRGNFDKYVDADLPQVKEKPIDDMLLADVENWREILAKNIAANNPTLSGRQLNYATQMIIDRILFLYIAEHRDIEPTDVIKNLAKKTGVYANLKALFRTCDERYNSGLFYFKKEKDRGENFDAITPKLTIDDSALKTILTQLSDSTYEFGVISADILGSVYERFLGKVIRQTTSGRVKIEEKPEVKKAGGIYYTPTYIVDSIVKNTVGELLAGKTLQTIENLTILDPACGSGSFLLSAYECLLQWYLGEYIRDVPKYLDKKKSKGNFLRQTPNGYELTTDVKKKILKRHIYGVDTDAQAVEVAKLSLLLKVLEGETKETIDLQLGFYKERALPDLSDHILCGNSLVGSDFYHSSGSAQTQMYDEEMIYKVNAFDWEEAFAQVFARGGFDAVIGNPPYIRIQNLHEYSPETVPYIKQRYKSASAKNVDIYVAFLEKAYDLLREGGKQGFIIPHRLFETDMGENIRSHLAEKKAVEKIIHFHTNQIFQNATTYTCLLFTSKKENKGIDFYRFKAGDDVAKMLPTVATKKIPAPTQADKKWHLLSSEEKKVMDALSRMPLRLADITERIFVGLQTSADDIYVLHVPQPAHLEVAGKNFNNDNGGGDEPRVEGVGDEEAGEDEGDVARLRWGGGGYSHCTPTWTKGPMWTRRHIRTRGHRGKPRKKYSLLLCR